MTRPSPAGLRTLVVLLVTLTSLCGTTASVSVVRDPLTIAAFNVQRFGITKLGRDDVMEVLVRLVTRYDIVLIQEIVDVSDTVIHTLVDRARVASGRNYTVQLSARVGRNAYEQYGYVYRQDRVVVRNKTLYPDPTDVFEREPYIVTFGLSGIRYLEEVTIVGLHTKPSKADVEIDAMSDVLDFVRQDMGASDVILMGDFNAGCSYVTETEWRSNRLRHRSDVTWAIADHTDTTVSSTNCAYDRIILHGDNLAKAVVSDSIGPFRYDEPWGISFDLTGDVSDHYPVELTLMPKAVRAAERYLYPLDVYSVTDRRGVSKTDVRALLVSADATDYTVQPMYDVSGTLVRVEATYKSHKNSGDAILETLVAFRSVFPRVVTEYDLALLRYKVSAGALNDPSVYEEARRPRWYAKVVCSAGEGARCEVVVEKRSLVA